MNKIITILFILTFAFRLNAEMTDVGPYLVNLKNKTDQSTAHIADTVRHVTFNDEGHWNNSVTNNQNPVTLGVLNATYLTSQNWVFYGGSRGIYKQNQNAAKYYIDDATAGGAYPIALHSGDGATYKGGEIRLNIDGNRVATVTTNQFGITNNLYVGGTSTFNSNVTINVTGGNALTLQKAGVTKAYFNPDGDLYSHDVFVDDIPASWSTSPIIPSLYKNITDLGAPVSPIVVNLTPAQTIYKVEVSAVNTLSNNFAGISFSTARNVEWETWINYTTTNSLSTTWPANINWDVGVPELTVTGMYKFVFSTIDGLEIRGKQIYPTVYPWVSVPSSTFAVPYPSLSVAIWTITAPITNSISFYNPVNSEGDYSLSTLSFLLKFGKGYNPNTGRIDGSLRFKRGDAANSELNMSFADISEKETITSNTIEKVLYSKIRAIGNFYVYGEKYAMQIIASNVYGTATAFINYPRLKKPNELEIKAYNAGWRP